MTYAHNLFILLFLWTGLTVAAEPFDKEKLVSNLKDGLLSISTNRLTSQYSDSALYSTKVAISSEHKDLIDQVEPILILWIAGQKDFLLLEWYRQKSELKRAVIVALFLSEDVMRGIEPKNGKWPDYVASWPLFNEVESQRRQNEFFAVRSEVINLAGHIYSVLVRIVPAESLKGIKFTSELPKEKYELMLKGSSLPLRE